MITIVKEIIFQIWLLGLISKCPFVTENAHLTPSIIRKNVPSTLEWIIHHWIYSRIGVYSLSALNKGIYIYTIGEGGERSSKGFVSSSHSLQLYYQVTVSLSLSVEMKEEFRLEEGATPGGGQGDEKQQNRKRHQSKMLDLSARDNVLNKLQGECDKLIQTKPMVTKWTGFIPSFYYYTTNNTISTRISCQSKRVEQYKNILLR